MKKFELTHYELLTIHKIPIIWFNNIPLFWFLVHIWELPPIVLIFTHVVATQYTTLLESFTLKSPLLKMVNIIILNQTLPTQSRLADSTTCLFLSHIHIFACYLSRETATVFAALILLQNLESMFLSQVVELWEYFIKNKSFSFLGLIY